MFGPRRHVAVGVFTDREHARRACEQLSRAGFRPEQVQVVVRDEERVGEYPAGESPRLRAEGHAALWGLVGLIVGCLLGLFLAGGWVSGLGPLAHGGAAGQLIGAAIGAVLGAVLGSLIGWGFALSDDGFYADEVRSGKTLVVIHDEARADEAVEILRQNRASRPRRAVTPTSPRMA